MPYSIEKGVPAPRRPKMNPPGPWLYPWAEMEAGDSFLVLRTDPSFEGARRGAYAQSRNGKVFVARRRTEGLRVWRIE